MKITKKLICYTIGIFALWCNIPNSCKRSIRGRRVSWSIRRYRGK